MKTCQAAVMVDSRADLQLREYPLPEVSTGEALVRVRCCTICRSDLHSWQGKRTAPTPLILGHEITGQIVAMGNGLERDAAGQKLAVGDRVSWTLHSCCGTCIYCQKYHLPMKCLSLRKYGHDRCDNPPHLQGGFAEYCLIDAGTSLLKLPDNLTYRQAAPLNCAAATVAAGWDAAHLATGENVLIQGAGGLGCYAAAFANLLGAKHIIATDFHAERLALCQRFGASAVIDLSQSTDEEALRRIRQLTGGLGVDCVLEVAGAPAAVPMGLAALRKGGRYIELGCSFPAANVNIDLSTILWNLLTVRGVHNYSFAHLQQAVQLVSRSADSFPYEQLVTRSFRLDEINQALAFAETCRLGRVAIEFAD